MKRYVMFPESGPQNFTNWTKGTDPARQIAMVKDELFKNTCRVVEKKNTKIPFYIPSLFMDSSRGKWVGAMARMLYFFLLNPYENDRRSKTLWLGPEELEKQLYFVLFVLP
jgi:hypothetical protein